MSSNLDHKALFALRDRKAHGQRRKLLSHAFARTSILSLEPFMQHKISLLCLQWRDRILKGESIDIYAWYRFLAADIISGSYPFSILVYMDDRFAVIKFKPPLDSKLVWSKRESYTFIFRDWIFDYL